nr:MAG TPA: hypothetical protein [Caudoviricetes sp.]
MMGSGWEIYINHIIFGGQKNEEVFINRIRRIILYNDDGIVFILALCGCAGDPLDRGRAINQGRVVPGLFAIGLCNRRRCLVVRFTGII